MTPIPPPNKNPNFIDLDLVLRQSWGGMVLQSAPIQNASQSGFVWSVPASSKKMPGREQTGGENVSWVGGGGSKTVFGAEF